MIARWMLAAIAFATLVGLAALAIEHALRAVGRPLRGPWAVAVIVGTLWPLIAPLVLAARSAPDSIAVPILTTSSATAIISAVDSTPRLWLERLDPFLLAAWALASTLLLLQVAFAVRTLRRVRIRAQAISLDGESVLVDAHIGPAVIGLTHPRIVVPAWLLDFDAPLRALVLRHEREHCRAGDARLVWLSVMATTIAPWNPALWWMARRLRAAMEIDCDARMLLGEADMRRYASLLLLIAQRHASARFLPLLSPAASQLNRRISAMRSSIPRFRVARVSFAVAGAALAVIAACSPRVASNLTSPSPAVATPQTTSSGAAPVGTRAPALDTGADRQATLIAGNQAPKYPESLRVAKIGAAVKVMFVVNADGLVDTGTVKFVEVATSAGAPADAKSLIVKAVRAALLDMRYAPARVGGRNVRQLVSMPFEFSAGSPITRSAGAESRPATVGVDPVTGADKPYFDFQVEQPASALNGTGAPQYPPQLRDQKVEGMVLAQFVVDTLGVPDMRTFKVVKSDHERFSDAVRASVAGMKFAPARVGGRGVKQLVQMPFQFALAR